MTRENRTAAHQGGVEETPVIITAVALATVISCGAVGIISWSEATNSGGWTHWTQAGVATAGAVGIGGIGLTMRGARWGPLIVGGLLIGAVLGGFITVVRHAEPHAAYGYEHRVELNTTTSDCPLSGLREGSTRCFQGYDTPAQAAEEYTDAICGGLTGRLRVGNRRMNVWLHDHAFGGPALKVAIDHGAGRYVADTSAACGAARRFERRITRGTR